MARITKHVKLIADAHIAARISGKFDNPPVSCKDDVIKALHDGKTIEGLLDEIEVRYNTITSVLCARQLGQVTQSYKSAVYHGFKKLLS